MVDFCMKNFFSLIRSKMDNYDYIADYVNYIAREFTPDRPLSVLDYGCGKGRIVEILSGSGPHIRAFGCDVFQEELGYRQHVKKELLDDGLILDMKDDRIPFADCTFDIVVSNMVMEHVENLELTISDICRVLKPGGILLSLFPDKSIWQEGHCGIPFVHWLKKGSRLKLAYLYFFRCLGFGYHKEDKTRIHWSTNFRQYLDQMTHYRSYKEIMSTFSKFLEGPEHIEREYLKKRLRHPFIVSLIPEKVLLFFFRKLAGMVFVFRKSNTSTCNSLHGSL